MQTLNILLTSVGRRTYMIDFFKEALKGRGKVFASNSIMTSSFQNADEYTLTPSIYDSSYGDFLMSYCKANNITAILSWFDVDLSVLTKEKERFKENGISIIVSDQSAIRLCNDKLNTHQFIKSLGLKQPKTYLDLNLAKQDIAAGELSFPCFVKPRWGMGSIGVYQASTMDELDVVYQRSLREAFTSYMKYESEGNRDACILVQEKIVGVEHGLDIFNDLHGNYVTTIAKRKTEMLNGETHIAQIIDSKPLEDIGRLIATNIRHVANMDVDCFITASGEIFVIDMNCRFGGQYSFSHLAGANFPKQIVEWLMGYPTSTDNITAKIGVKGVKDSVLPIRF